MVSIGINNTATAVDAVYIGVENVAKRIVAAYIGIDGKAMAVAIASRLTFVTVKNDFNTRHQQIMVTCDGNVYTASFIALSGKPFTAEVIALQQFDAGTLNVTSGRIKKDLVITATEPKPHYDTYLEFEIKMEAVPVTLSNGEWDIPESGTMYRPVTVRPLNDLTPTFDVSQFKFEVTDIDSALKRGNLTLPHVYAAGSIPSYFAMDIVIDGVSSSIMHWSSFYEDFPESYIVGIKDKTTLDYTQSIAELLITDDGTLAGFDWFGSFGVHRESILTLLKQKINTDPYFKIGFGFYEMQNGVEIDLPFNDVGLISVRQEDKKFKANGYKAVVKKEVPFFVKTETIASFYQGLYTTTPSENRYMVLNSYEPLALYDRNVDFVLPLKVIPAVSINYGSYHPQITAIPDYDSFCVIGRHGLNGVVLSENLTVTETMSSKIEVASKQNVAGTAKDKAIFFSTGQPLGNTFESVSSDGTYIVPTHYLWQMYHYDFYAVSFNDDVLRIGGYFYGESGEKEAAPTYKVDTTLTITTIPELYDSAMRTTYTIPFSNDSYMLFVIADPTEGNEYYVYSTDYTAIPLSCVTYWPPLYRIPWRNGCVFDCGYDAVNSLPKMKFLDSNLTMVDLPHKRYIYGAQNSSSDYHIETSSGTLTVTDNGFVLLDSIGTRHVLSNDINSRHSNFPLVTNTAYSFMQAKPQAYAPLVQLNKYAVLTGTTIDGYGGINVKSLGTLDLTKIDDLITWMQTNIV